MAICHALFYCAISSTGRASVSKIDGVGSSPAWRAKIQENKMLRFLMCLFGFHGATEIDYTIDDEEIKVCRDCMKEV